MNTITCCWWLMSAFTVYYSIFGLFATYMTKELHLTAAQVGWPLVFSNGLTFIFSFVWGSLTDSIGRRWAMIIPAVIGACRRADLPADDRLFHSRGRVLDPGRVRRRDLWHQPELCQRTLPDRNQSDRRGFCYHMGAIAGGFVPPVLTYFAVERAWASRFRC